MFYYPLLWKNWENAGILTTIFDRKDWRLVLNGQNCVHQNNVNRTILEESSYYKYE